MPAQPARARPRQNGSQIARSPSIAFSSEVGTGSREERVKIKTLLNLRGGRIALALVVDPADFQLVALLAALEREFDVGVLGDGSTPIGDEYAFAVVFEGQFPDEMRRNDLALGVLDEAGIHRVLDQRLDFGGLAARARTHANGRCHQSILVISHN